MVGGGDSSTQTILTNQFAMSSLMTIFVVRFLLGPWSYAAGCPGGLFAPLLLLGASSGALFAGGAAIASARQSTFPPAACAIVGMGALFTASVRAPLTGIVLTVEMTGRADLTLGLLGASLTAMLVAMLLQSEPIYDSLKRRMLSQDVVSPRRVDAGVERVATWDIAGSPRRHRVHGDFVSLIELVQQTKLAAQTAAFISVGHPDRSVLLQQRRSFQLCHPERSVR